MDNVPIVLGQYRLGKTLGIGAFGKVKSTNQLKLGIRNYLIQQVPAIGITLKMKNSPNLIKHLLMFFSLLLFFLLNFECSGSSYNYGSESCCKDSQ